MGTIKLELDLPDFKDHVEVKVIINKDGVQECTSSYKKLESECMPKITEDESSGNLWKQSVNTYQSSEIVEAPDPSTIPPSMMMTF